MTNAPLEDGFEESDGAAGNAIGADARLRLAYINQHRELGLGLLLALGLGARLLGAPISGAVLGLGGVWLVLASAFVRLSTRAVNERRLGRLACAYFVGELTLITLLAHYSGAAEWLALLFYVVTILYAHMVLPRREAMAISALAAIGFSALVGLDSLGVIETRQLFAGTRFHEPIYLALMLAAGALAAYLLIGFSLSQFARTLSAQSLALRRANQELRLHRHHLEELVEQRTHDLRRASEELQSANRDLRRLNELKSSFLANVSHELRTPLTSIRSFSEILLNYPDEDVFTRSEFLEIIITETDRLTRLINDVLDLAKIEAGRIEWRLGPVQVAEAVRETLDVIQVVAGHKRVRLINLVGNDAPLIAADGDRVRQVLTNLLSNALKFTSSGSIQVGTLERGSDLVLYVADTGTGMPQSELERIFDKFYQRGDVMTAKPAGTGLGLSICQEIMHHHGGRIWAESVEGQGSTFYCAFPKLEQAALSAGAAAGEVKVGGGAGKYDGETKAGVAQVLPEGNGQQHGGQDNEDGGEHRVSPATVGRALTTAPEYE